MAQCTTTSQCMTHNMCHMHNTCKEKGIDLDVCMVFLLKMTITAMTPAQGILCIREFLPNSKKASKPFSGTSTHPHTSTGVVVRTHISL
jgi:hypothetical protein